MPYTNPDTMMEVANILDSFDEENLIEIFKSQILSTEDYTSLQINHLAPLYTSYKRVMSMEAIDEDDVIQVQTRFQNICMTIINLICNKFNLEIDTNWIESNYGKLPAFTMCMYQFFVLDIFYVILKSLNNYISKNIDELHSAFADAIQSKDVSTTTNLKTMDPKYATLASCMYDVTDYAFTMMDSDSIFEYIDNKYVPGAVLDKLMDEGTITGDFANTFANIYKDNLALRSKITFELIYKIKKEGYLTYNPLIIREDQLQQNAQSELEEDQNIDTSDDGID